MRLSELLFVLAVVLIFGWVGLLEIAFYIAAVVVIVMGGHAVYYFGQKLLRKLSVLRSGIIRG